MDVKGNEHFNSFVITSPLGDVRRTRIKSTGRAPSQHFIKEILQKAPLQDDNESTSSEEIEKHTDILELQQSLIKSAPSGETAMENNPGRQKIVSQKKVTIMEPSSKPIIKTDAPWLLEFRKLKERKLSFRKNEGADSVEPTDEKTEIIKVEETTKNLRIGKIDKQQPLHTDNNITTINEVKAVTYKNVSEVNRVFKLATIPSIPNTKENKEIKPDKQCDDQICVDFEGKPESKNLKNEDEVKSDILLKKESGVKNEKQKNSDLEHKENYDVTMRRVDINSNNKHCQKTKNEITKQVDTDVKEKLTMNKLKAPFFPADEFNIKSNGVTKMVVKNLTNESEKDDIKELQNNERLLRTNKNFKEPSVTVSTIEQIIHNMKDFEKKANETMNQIKKDLDNIKYKIDLHYEDEKTFMKLVETDLLNIRDKH